MKKNLIAMLLSVVLVSGSIFAVPVQAAETAESAETTAQEAGSVQEEAEDAEDAENAEEEVETPEEETPEEAKPAEEESVVEEETAPESDEQDESDEPEEETEAPSEEITSSEQDAEDPAAAEEPGSGDTTGDTSEDTTDTGEAEPAEEAEPTEETDTGDTSKTPLYIEDIPVFEDEPITVEGTEEAMADDNSCGTNAAWNLSGTGSSLTLTISGSGKMSNYNTGVTPWKDSASKIKKVVIKSGITGLGNYCFTSLDNLTSVTIPDTVTSVGIGCFSNCSSIQSISLPSGVKSINEKAFKNCSSLTGLTIPKGVKSLSESTFSGCSALKSVSIPDTVTYISSYVFENCRSLTSVTVPNSVTSIGGSCFRGCIALKSITIGSGVTSIGFNAFNDCRSLTSVKIPTGVKKLNTNLFHDCTNLTSVSIPNTVTVIDENVFSGCGSLTSITIPDSVTSIGKMTFADCTALKSVSLGDSLTKIGESVFINCGSLTSITIPESVTSIGQYAFGLSDTKTNVNFRGTKDQWDSAVGSNEICYKSISYNYFSVDATFKLSGTSFTYTGKEIKPTVTVTYEGAKLVEGTDYSLEYKDNKNAGKASVIISGMGKYDGSATKTFTINKAVNKITAKNLFKTYSAKDQSFALGAKITNGTPKYSSNTKSVTVSRKGLVTVKAKFIGKATITITAPEYINYSKTTKKITITVNPTKTTIVSATSPAAGKMTVKWKKNTVGSGYQVQYSTSSKFATVKSAWLSKNTVVSKTITGLTKGKKYYVRVRTIKNVNGTKYYSYWSAVKTVTIKK